MGFKHKPSPGGSRDPGFGFAFNNSNFSDRILRIEIVADPTVDPPESEICQTLTDRGTARKSKRRRVDVAEKENEDETPASSSDEDGSRVLRVETFNVSSLLLASNSPFFYKLFSNGMLESKKQCVTIRIGASEEDALVELLNFMYSGTLRVNTASAVLDVLIIADKFGVASCMSHCCGFLKDMVMTPESALLYLELPTNILRSEAVKPLMDAANQFLVACYKDVSQHNDEVMNLPLVGIEAILSSDELHVCSEDEVYEIALKWTEIHFQNSEERRDILCTRLGRYIRFPQMSPQKLREVLTCDYLDKDFATKVVLDALFFKVDTPHRRRARPVEDSACFVERAYKFQPIKVVEFELPSQHCMVYMELKRKECAGLSPSSGICFHPFPLGGQVMFMAAKFSNDSQCFKLFLGAKERGSKFAIVYESAVRSKPSEEYISMCKGKYDFTGGTAVGYRKLFMFSIPWTLLMADDSPYFINGVLYLRAEFTVKRGGLV